MTPLAARPILKLFGIPLVIHWSTAVIACFVALQAQPLIDQSNPPIYALVSVGVVLVLLFFGSILAHEAAHAATAKVFGLGVRRIALWGFGGSTEIEHDASQWYQRALISFAGPATNGVLAVVFLGLSMAINDTSIAGRVFFGIALLNAFVAVFNLLPGLPLDGGHILAAVTFGITGDESKGWNVAAIVGQAVGITTIAVGIAGMMGVFPIGDLWLAFIGYILFTSAARSRVFRRQQASVRGVAAGALAAPVPPSARGDLTVNEYRMNWAPFHPMTDYLIVTDPEGRTTGLIDRRQIEQVPDRVAADVALGDVAIPVDAMSFSTPTAPLEDALRTSPSGIVLIVDQGRVAGIVTPAAYSHLGAPKP